MLSVVSRNVKSALRKTSRTAAATTRTVRAARMSQGRRGPGFRLRASGFRLLISGGSATGMVGSCCQGVSRLGRCDRSGIVDRLLEANCQRTEGLVGQTGDVLT